MADVFSKKSSIRWRYFPNTYYRLEKYLMPKLSNLFTVRKDVAMAYKKSYPHMAESVKFLPTFMDPDIFYPAPKQDRELTRLSLRNQLGLPNDAILGVMVGRLESEKNPSLILDALAQIAHKYTNFFVIFIGDGTQKFQLIKKSQSHDFENRVFFLGLMQAHEIANIFRASDIYLLSSSTEGMPIALLEAQACGLPAVATDVGEVKRIIQNGVNGRLIEKNTPACMANGIKQTIDHLSWFKPEASISAVQPYTAENALELVYENYFKLAFSKKN
jgi:glycosyltransferase involved in cell wall biosynthesis